HATPLPVAAAPTAAPPPTPAAAPGIDSKVIEEEVQRQIAARKKELQKALDASKPAREAPAPATSAAAPPAAALRKPEEAPAPTALPVKEKEPAPEPAPPPAREAAPEPTAPPRPAPTGAAPRVEAREEVSRGDLVGPGPGVVEPVLIGTPRVNYPALARQQRVGGKVIVLVLVNEEGAVTDAHLEQGVPPRYGVNEAVVAAVRRSKFRPATKNGVPVKMWRTVVVEVKP
ncbi:MAG TPA: TonB family protein, partial [Anaeromyxobacter sp.]